MFSYNIVFGVGLVISLFNVCIWLRVILAQTRQFTPDKKNNSVKVILLTFGILSLMSNFVPMWYDIYRLANQTSPTNIFYAYVMNSYLYRTATAIMFYLVYKY